MYESFFGFSARPFSAAPLAGRYFPAPAIESARQTLIRTIERSEGIGLVVGPAGCGKTLLCQVLAEKFRGILEIALLSGGSLCTRRGLLQAILFELGLPYRGMEEGDLRLLLLDRLSPRTATASATSVPPLNATSACAVSKPISTAAATNAPAGISLATNASSVSGGLLLIVDEAHTLPLRLLEELRLITNIVRGGQARVRLILAGGPQLEERFASPKLESFNQRVAARCYLEALDRQQTIDYVRYQIAQVGGQPDRTFTADALDAIHSATDGIGRLVNQVCDHALLLAYAGGVSQLTAEGIEEAWSDLQQLPTPRNAHEGAPAKPQSGSVIEFGSLDDDDPADSLPSAVPFRTVSEESLPLSKGQQLQRLTAKLVELDDDFQPAGSIGPELEISLPAVPNPFDDAFEEEEVVIDRYTPLVSDTFANLPVVRSAESRQLGALLSAVELLREQAPDSPPTVSLHQPTAPAAHRTSSGTGAPARPNWPGGVPTEPLSLIAKSSTLGPGAAQDPMVPAALSSTSLLRNTEIIPSAQSADESVTGSHPESQALLIKQYASTVWPKQELPGEQISPIATQAADSAGTLSTTTFLPTDDNDADLIVIEDAIEPLLAVPKQPVAKVRRREYRQLFSQLRHG